MTYVGGPLPVDNPEEMLKSISDLMEQVETLREAVNAVLNWYGNDRLIAFPGEQLVEALGTADLTKDRTLK
jgi:hypothetical protein